MAGVTIAALTGSDSAPSKANEASQKQDIGAAKDDVSLAVTNAITDAYQTAYVETGVSAGEASTTVGTEVIKTIAQKYQTNNQIGKASIEIDEFGTISSVTGNATVTISTTDFLVEGTIYKDGGKLTWGEILPNTPRIKLNKKNIALPPGSTDTLSVTFKQLEETIIEWSTSDSSVATVSDGVVTIKSTANDDDTVIITAKATYGEKEYTATCNVLVAQISIPATQALINTSTMIGADVLNYTANEVSNWQVFYATENEVFIISKDVLETDTALQQKNIKNNTTYNGSTDAANIEYCSIWNKKWITACSSIESNMYNANTTAYLCDTDNWEKYVSAPALYSVGGPTYELLLKSVEIKQPTALSSTSLSSTYVGYQESDSSSIMTNLSAPYFVTSKSWFLASPSNFSVGSRKYYEGWYMCCVDSLKKVDEISYNNAYGIRPLVSIPMNKIKIIGNKVKIVK